MSEVLLKHTLPQTVLQWSNTQPDKIAVASGEKGTTYKELQTMVDSCAAYLLEIGAKQGDYVLISAVMKAEYVAAFLAIKGLRMVAVPINKTASETEVKDIVERLDAKIFMTDNPRYKMLKQCVSLQKSCHQDNFYKFQVAGETEYIPGEEVTEILFTSGTTGKPKGAMLSQGGIAASIHNTATGMKMQNSDIILLPLPLNHSFGLRVMRSALFRGETIVLQNGFSFASELQRNIETWHCNCMIAVNAGFEMLQQQMGEDYKNCFKDMRYIEFSAGAVPANKRRQLVEDLPDVRLHNTWGSTETGGGLFLEFSANKDKIESAGAAINDTEVTVLDNDGNIVPIGEYGRLALKGKALMLGYYDDPKQTADALHGEWLWTNDMAKMDADGYVYLNGRVDDIISVGGEKVAPADIEKIISVQPGVRECACCGVEDPKGILGQVPVVFMVADANGYDEKQIEEQIRRLGNGFMVPAAFIKLQELPRNYMGKIDRKAMKEIWNASLKGEMPEVNQQSDDNFADKVLELITARRSVRAFLEKPVERELLDKLLLAGRMAPSGHNMQTWRFTVLQRQDKIATLKEVTAKVAAEKKSLFYGFQNPQALIIVSNDRRNADGVQDASAAIENILLMAHAMGLGACWINALHHISDEPEIREVLNSYSIPKTHLVYGMVGIGYPQSVPKMPVKKENVINFIE